MYKGKHRLVNWAVEHPRLIVAVALLITIGLALPIPGARIDTDPENMLQASEPVRVIHSRIKDDFNLSDYLVVGFVDNAKSVITPEFTERLGHLVAKIEEMEGVVAEDILAPSTVDDIYRTADGALVVGPLTEPRQDIAGPQPTLAEKVSENPILAGKLASMDGRAVALYIPLEEKKFAHIVAEQIEHEITAAGGFPAHHITGLPVAEETFGQEMFKQMAMSAPAAGVLILLLMLAFFRKLSVVMAPMLVAVMTVVWTMGLLVLLGFTVHIMSSMIAIFLMPIAVLNSIHILSEFHDRYQKAGSQKAAILSTMDELFKPMVFTSLTTIVGFGSLMFAPIPPVRVFGGFVAFGVAVAWLLSVVFNPAYAVLLSKRRLSNFGRTEEEDSLLGRLLPAVGRWATGSRFLVVTLTLVALAVSVVGITKIQVNDNPTRWFKAGHPIRVAEQELGSHLAGTYLAYLEFDANDTEDGTVKTPDVLHYMQGLQDRLGTFDLVGATTGVTDIVKKVRFELLDGDSAMYAIPDDAAEISQELFLYEIAGGDPEDLYKFITPDGDKAVLWLQLRNGDNRAVSEVVAAVGQYVACQPPPEGLKFDWAGLTYINVVWQEKMVKGMLNALLGSFVVVLIMMTLLLRSVRLGLISMVPLSVTIALVYGAVGLLGKYYDMPIAILSSLTLGLSIDFAIHFLKRGQDIYRSEKTLARTLDVLFDEPARAIARNIVVIALGFVPLLFSALVPYVTVGSFFLAIMGLSGLATLVILPALVRMLGEYALVPWGGKRPTPETDNKPKLQTTKE
jgi:predicted RND superfamily exporter protein